MVINQVAKASVVGMAFFIPLSNTITTLFSIVCLAASLFSIDRQKLSSLLRHPVTKAVLIMVALCLIGITYSVGTNNDILQALRKSSRLLYIPVLLIILDKKEWRRYAILAFLAGVTVLTVGKMVGGHIALKDSIFTSLFVACAIFILLHYFLDNARYRWLVIPLLMLLTYYLMFISIGRTGQVLLFGLYLLFCWQRFGLNIKRQIMALVLLAALITITLILPSSFVQRQKKAATEVQNYLQDSTSSVTESSMGLRMAFAQNAIKLIKLRPLFGWGTGGFPEAYLKNFPNAKDIGANTVNPHNQYLLTAVELGLFGVCGLLYLFFTIIREFWRSKDPDARLGLGLVTAVAVGCLVNSWLLDYASMFFFVVLTGILLSGTYKQVN